MKANDLSQKNCANLSTKKRVAAIGRWMPIHNGHKAFLVKLAKNEDYEKDYVSFSSFGDIFSLRRTFSDKKRRLQPKNNYLCNLSGLRTCSANKKNSYVVNDTYRRSYGGMYGLDASWPHRHTMHPAQHQ